MDSEIYKQYMYKNDIHLSKIISYKPISLATMNTVKIISIFYLVEKRII